MHNLFDNKNIFIALTYRCNANCKKCMTRFHKNRNIEMPVSLIDVITDKLRCHHFSGLVSVGSGEPLLYPNFKYFFDSILSVNDGISLRILSNGMAFGTDLPPEYFSPRCKWGITMDAFTQEGLAGFQDGVQIETVKKNIREIVRQYGSECLYLNYTLHNRNYHEIREFCAFAADLGISEIYATELKVYDGFEQRLQPYRLSHDPEVCQALSQASELLKENGISDAGIKLKASSEKSGCFMENSASPIIDVDGSVAFCSGHEDALVGNIMDAHIERLWENAADRLAQNPEKWCQFCHARPLDSGCYNLPGSISREALLQNLNLERNANDQSNK